MTQDALPLTLPVFHLDRASREAGRRGVQKARQALAQARAKAADADTRPATPRRGRGAADDRRHGRRHAA